MFEKPDYSPSFYREHAREYADYWGVTPWPINSPSHPGLKGISDVFDRLKELVPPGARGLDAGCGPSVLELYNYWRQGYDVVGVDAVEENLEVARRDHPELEGRLFFADLAQPLGFPDRSFDFIVCTTVIQHMAPEEVFEVTLPEFARVLRPQGVLQLVFKSGKGVATLFDRTYGMERSFQLYDPAEMIDALGASGLGVVPEEEGKLGGVMHFTDEKGVYTCILLARKAGPRHWKTDEKGVCPDSASGPGV